MSFWSILTIGEEVVPDDIYVRLELVLQTRFRLRVIWFVLTFLNSLTISGIGSINFVLWSNWSFWWSLNRLSDFSLFRSGSPRFFIWSRNRFVWITRIQPYWRDYFSSFFVGKSDQVYPWQPDESPRWWDYWLIVHLIPSLVVNPTKCRVIIVLGIGVW